MKRSLILLCGVMFTILSCQKNIDSPAIQNSLTVSGEATAVLAPLKAHVASFKGSPSIAYLRRYSMNKTFYADTRVSGLSMISPSGQPFSYQYDEKFIYSTNKATMIGKRYFYEYEGSGLVVKETLTDNVEFLFNKYNLCTSVVQLTPTGRKALVNLYYNTTNPNFVFLTNMIFYYTGFTDQYLVKTDSRGNIMSVKNVLKRGIKYTYNNVAKPNLFYEPSEDAVNEWYSLLETMQWVPQPKNERTSYTTSWGTDGQPTTPEYNVVVRQIRNPKYDSKNSLVGYTTDHPLETIPKVITWKY